MDLPIPGSPPSSIRLPLTIPPPKTLSSSFISVTYLCSSSVEISVTFLGSLYDVILDTDFAVFFSYFCSTPMLFKSGGGIISSNLETATLASESNRFF